MKKVIRKTVLSGLLVVLAAAWQAQAQAAKTPYPTTMAPLDQYLMERNAEIELSRTAAPPSISSDAEIMVLGKHGYETAVLGKNGFVCMVQRSWISPYEDPEFWNSKTRSPICLNPAGARSYLPLIVKKTDLVLAGRSQAEMVESISAAIDKKELPGMEPGAMSYMMSKQAHLSDQAGHWHPHLMFFVPPTDPVAWGAGLSGSPIFVFKDSPDHVTVFLVPVRTWSDGTADVANGH